MKLEASPWARNSLTPEDRAEIAQADPWSAVCVLLARHPHGPYSARVTGVVPMQTLSGGSITAIGAFRDAMSKVTP